MSWPCFHGRKLQRTKLSRYKLIQTYVKCYGIIPTLYLSLHQNVKSLSQEIGSTCTKKERNNVLLILQCWILKNAKKRVLHQEFAYRTILRMGCLALKVVMAYVNKAVTLDQDLLWFAKQQVAIYIYLQGLQRIPIQNHKDSDPSTLISDNLCHEITCSVSGEICHSGECKCGNQASCESRPTGSYCDAGSSMCKCAPNVDACQDGISCINGDCDIGMTHQPHSVLI